MTNRFAGNGKAGAIVTPIGIYCYFGLNCNSESCEVSNYQTQSVNKRYYFNLLFPTTTSRAESPRNPSIPLSSLPSGLDSIGVDRFLPTFSVRRRRVA